MPFFGKQDEFVSKRKFFIAVFSIGHRLKTKDFTRGFSLVEMVVVVAIVVIISTVTILSYVRTGERVALGNAANDLVGRVREAQANAMAVRRHANGQYPSWGIYIDLATPKQTILYADLDGNSAYTPSLPCGSVTSECVKIQPLPNGVSVSALCGTFADTAKAAIPGVPPCSGGASRSDYFDIFFKRPFADVWITGEPGDGAPTDGYRTSSITLRTARGYQKVVSINYASEMTVQ